MPNCFWANLGIWIYIVPEVLEDSKEFGNFSVSPPLEGVKVINGMNC